MPPPNFSAEAYKNISEKVKKGEKSLEQFSSELGLHPSTLRWRLRNLFLPTNKEFKPLTPYQEKVLTLHKQGLSNYEIGERLNRSAQSVRTALCRAKKAEVGIIRRKITPIRENKPYQAETLTTPTLRE